MRAQTVAVVTLMAVGAFVLGGCGGGHRNASSSEPNAVSHTGTTQEPAAVRSDSDSEFSHERLHATLWVQTSAEHRILCELVYRQARASLDEALADPTTTAALEQSGDVRSLPPAIVLDLDETVIDNGPFQGQLVLSRTDYDPDIWQRWSDKACAKAVPGALEFLAYARSKGVRTVFVTNRLAREENATRMNLEALGIPVEDDDVILCKYEEGHKDWSSDKSSRRAYVAKQYRICLLIGDDLNDFMPAKQMASSVRVARAEIQRHRFGRTWLLLPNPLYGSWEAAVLGGKYVKDAAEVARMKFEAVRGFE